MIATNVHKKTTALQHFFMPLNTTNIFLNAKIGVSVSPNFVSASPYVEITKCSARTHSTCINNVLLF
jgi:hypothetical protein